MPGENVEVVRRLYEAVARHDAETVLDLYHPDVEWDFTNSPVGDAMSRRVYRGHEGLRLWWREWSEAWERYNDGYDELIEANDHVIVKVTSRGRGRASGADVAWTQYGVWSVRDGRIVRVEWFRDLQDAQVAAGAR